MPSSWQRGGELEVGDPARREVRGDVDVRIERAADELPRAFGGDGMVGHRAPNANKIVNNLVW